MGEAEFTPDNAQCEAAWCLYVELVTRVAVQELQDQHGTLREALSSLHAIFPATRQILKDAGPRVGAKAWSIGGISIRVLNRGLRPVLAKWHPLLADWEARRPATRSPLDHEAQWAHHAELRNELIKLRRELALYAGALGKACGVEEE